MRALKVLVVLMGVLIVAGTVALAVALVQRTNTGSAPSSVELALGQPAGSRIAGIAAAEGIVAVWVTRPDGDRVLLLDPQRNRVNGEIRLGN